MKESFVYILTNKNNSVLYIGVTSNLIQRVTDHKSGKGSIFTSKYNVYYLVYYEVFSSIDQAIKREKQLKKWNKSWKWELIKVTNPEVNDLFQGLNL